jgi:hypothetical protein
VAPGVGRAQDGAPPLPLEPLDTLPARAPSVRTTVTLSTDAVEIGEAFRLGIELFHPIGTRIETDLSPYGPDAGWLLLVDRPSPSLPEYDRGGLVTRVELELAALEQEPVVTDEGLLFSPSRRVPLPGLTWIGPEGERPLTLDPPELTVAGLLDLDERAPRPLPEPFVPPLEPPLVAPGTVTAALGALAVALAAGLAGLWWRRRAHARAALPATVEGRARTLATRLQSGDFDRERVFEAVRLVRDAVDRRLGHARPAATDDEWLSAVPREGDWLALRARLAEFLARATRVRYADLEPTEWAIEELVREGLELVEKVGALAPADERPAPRRVGVPA